MRYLVSVFILCLCFQIRAQREVNVWHFGYGAGIDFNSNPPLVVTDGKLNTYEGCASICDDYGKLLMYTDGDTVYNGKHQVMVNGIGLHGNYSSTQSAMIIKLPLSDSVYLIFNPGEVNGATKGFYYSEVNVYAKGGQGEVITKNIQLKANMRTESVSAVKHVNGQNVWVVFKNDNSNEFVSYLVTPLGVSNTMVFSQPGPIIGSGFPNGFTHCSKFSPSGKKYVISIPSIGVCLYDFDNKTGYLSNLQTIPVTSSYGVEFSPDEKKLYVSYSPKGLYQYDISSNNISSIIASEYRLLQYSGIGSLQLAPDKKIYAVKLNSTYMSVINYPDLSNDACGFVEDYVFLKGKKSGLGLPPFISTYFSDSLVSKIIYNGKCAGDDFKFECSNLKTTDSVSWNFDDMASGANNFSSIQKPTHIFSKADTFNINAAVYRKNINNHYILEGILRIRIIVLDFLGKANEYPPSLMKCIHDSVFVQTIGAGGITKVIWNDVQANLSTRYIRYPGKYVATIYRTGSECFYTDTISVADMPYTLKPDLGNDTMYCVPYGQSLNETLGTQLLSAYTYKWNSGETTKTIQITKAGTYIIQAEKANECASLDTVLVSMSSMPSYIPLRDTILCNDQKIKKILLTAIGYLTIQWSTGETGNMVTVGSAGKYRYSVNNQCAGYNDSFYITLLEAPVVDLGKDLTVCSANGFVLKSNVVGKSYQWLPGGEITESIISYEYGNISLEVKNAIGCIGRDDIFINDSCRQESYIPNVFTPNGDGLNDVFKPANNDIGSKGYIFRIFDRWGGIVYETDNVMSGWNGMVDDKRCISGIYFYTLEFVTTKRKTVHLNGTFTLLY